MIDDPALNVSWLADANLPAKQPYGLPVNASGSMDFPTALAWVGQLNAHNYLGRHNWMLPTTPTAPATDSTCDKSNASGGGSFGYGCTGSDLGHLYAQVLGLNHPQTAVHIHDSSFGPFKNVQPSLYWTDQTAKIATQGFITFSFETGWQGSNTKTNALYVLPMIQGNVTGRTPHGALTTSADGKLVYDANADVTWPTDADPAASNSFGVKGVNRDGSMGHLAAVAWVKQAKSNAYLGQTGWVLPPSTTCGGFNCKASPLGKLFYVSLGRVQGQSIATVPDTVLHGFRNLQPYLYWACPPPGPAGPCTTSAAGGLQWSFSFGNGFQGTDLTANDLFVMVYSPNTRPPGPPHCHTPITCCVLHGGTWAGGHCT